jgi:branched-chain amino acid transport system substrate-binding protein
LALAAAALAVLAIAGCGSSSSSSSGSSGSDSSGSDSSGSSSSSGGDTPTGDVKVVTILPTTGPLASVTAKATVGASRAATEVWNAAHPDRKVEMDLCNDEGNPEKSVSCVQRNLSSADVLNGPSFHNQYLAAAPLFERTKFDTTGDPLAVPSGDTTVFQATPTIQNATDAAMDYFKRAGLTKVAFLTGTDAIGTAAGSAAKRSAAASGVQLITASYDPDAATVAPQINQVLPQDPQAVFIWAVGPQGVLALRAMKDAGASVPAMLNFSSLTNATITLAAQAMPSQLLFTGSDAFVADAISDPTRRRFVEEFTSAYERQVGYQMLDWPGAAFADAAFVAFNAALHASDTNGMVDWLERGNPVAGLNATYRYSASDHVGLADGNPIRVVRYTGSGFVDASQ